VSVSYPAACRSSIRPADPARAQVPARIASNASANADRIYCGKFNIAASVINWQTQEMAKRRWRR
jgi:hypothetical protein